MAGDLIDGMKVSLQSSTCRSNYGAVDKQDQVKKKERLTWCGYLTDPHHWPYRLITLLLQCYIFFVAYYCAEGPGGLENTIIKVMGIDTTQYGLLLSVYAWPNIFLCLIGGVVVDRVLGRRASYVLMISLVGIGQFIWALGAFLNQFWLMLVGRFFIGIGTEMTDVVSTAFAAKWTNITFLMSVFYTAARLGASSALSGPQFVYENLTFLSNPLYRLGTTLLLGAGLGIIAVAVSIIVVILDKREEEILQREKKKMAKLQCGDLKKFSLPYWVSLAMISIYVPTITVYTGIGQVYYMQKFGLSSVAAGTANSLVFCSAIIIAPFIGFFINHVGRHTSWTIAGVLFALATHLILLISGKQLFAPYLAGVVYSISYAITIPSLYCIPGIVIDPSQTATAYGFVHCSYNIVMTVLAIVSGILIDYFGYLILELMFSITLYLMLILSIILWALYSTPRTKKGGNYRQETDPLIAEGT